jgi:hypothetical protein
VGSQWIDDDEFEERGWRYWNRVFRHGEKVDDDLASRPSTFYQDTKILGEDPEDWKQRIINVVGNHDIGYAGDISVERVERFERVFGKVNYELRFQLPTAHQAESDEEKPVPELRIVVLNDMNLDTPASSKEMQDQTYEFLNTVITTSEDVERPAHFTLLLTHIPMHKEAGICVDPPFFDFFTGEFNNGVKEQNHLSSDASRGFLEGIFGMNGDPSTPGHGFGRHGLILTGHDHEGCDTYHYINQTVPDVEIPLQPSPQPRWQARKWKDALSSGLLGSVETPGVREITVRSMMGDFAGNAGLLSLWFDEETWDWRFEFVNCGMGTQHLWWIVHILDLITIGFALAYAILSTAQRFRFFWEEKHARPEWQPTVIQTGDSKTPVRIRRGTLTALKIPVSARFVEDAIRGTELDDYLNTGKSDVPRSGKKSPEMTKLKRSMTIGGSNATVEFPKFND